jgi:hypothetical protein
MLSCGVHRFLELLASPHAFPELNTPFHETEQRMRQRIFQETPFRILNRGTRLQLPMQVAPFVKQLSASFVYLPRQPACGNLAGVKRIPAPFRFLKNAIEVGTDCSGRVNGRLKPEQLRMMLVTFGSPPQNLLRQKRFTPHGNQASHVQIPGVKGPEPHVAIVLADAQGLPVWLPGAKIPASL